MYVRYKIQGRRVEHAEGASYIHSYIPPDGEAKRSLEAATLHHPRIAGQDMQSMSGRYRHVLRTPYPVRQRRLQATIKMKIV